MTTLTFRRRRRLLSKGPDDIVRVYSFQRPEAWETARVRGYLTGSRDHIDPDYAGAYAWMMDRMAELVPGWSGEPPVWAYLARQNMRQDIYDPRPSVYVVADVPRRRMLLSDLNQWVEVLNTSHVVDTESEMEALEGSGEQTWGDVRTATPEMMATWEKVFEIDDSGWDSEKRAYRGVPEVVQACVDRIHLSEVVWTGMTHGRLGRRSDPRDADEVRRLSSCGEPAACPS